MSTSRSRTGTGRRATLADVGELEAIRRLTRRLAARPDVVAGAGDDCAVVRPAPDAPSDWLLTSDPVIEGIHFTAAAAPDAIGHKAAGRALSDLAAMGGEPDWALVDVVAPAHTPLARLEGIYRGLNRLADRFGLAVVGGDLSRGPALELHVFACGRVPRGSAILRSGARPGDRIFVTGALGGSGRGRHLRFTPRVAEGIWLREEGWPTAMIDISDGLARDLQRVLDRSGTGAEIDAAALPLAAAARRGRDGRGALDRALHDGEDFELLFTVPAGRAAAFPSCWRDTFELPCTCIGRITDRRGRLTLVGRDGQRQPLDERGFDHFRRRRS